jgi:hypothetical protein
MSQPASAIGRAHRAIKAVLLAKGATVPKADSKAHGIIDGLKGSKIRQFGRSRKPRRLARKLLGERFPKQRQRDAARARKGHAAWNARQKATR